MRTDPYLQLADLGSARQHPEILLEITISNAMANLTRREADVAIRPTPDPPETLVGRRIADIAHAVYGSKTYLSRRGSRAESDDEWVGLDDTLATTVIGRWMGENVEETQIVLRVDALPALRDAVRAGMGLALLPCYLADEDEKLRRAPSATVSDVRSALWLLTHNDLRRTARIRAVMDFLTTALGSERLFFEGKRYAKRVSLHAGAGTGRSKRS